MQSSSDFLSLSAALFDLSAAKLLADPPSRPASLDAWFPFSCSQQGVVLFFSFSQRSSNREQ